MSSMTRCLCRSLAVALAAIFFPPFSVRAGSAVITEIMYDLSGTDSGREWVEVQNTGAEVISFAEWKFFEDGTNHGLSLARGEATTTPGGFATIADDPAKFLLDWPAFTGTLFSSSFSLGNSGETLALKLGGAIVDQVTYSSTTGAAGDGQSLQKTAGGWQAFPPTPGAAAGASAAPAPSVPASSSQTSASANAVSSGVSDSGAPSPLAQKIFVHMTAPERAVAGADVLFEAAALGLKKEPLANARFLWSFGDGASAEGKRVLHVYHYPATYVVLVEASSGEWSATERRDIAVAASMISIPRIQVGLDGFIELQNRGADDMDLSRWFLKSGSQFFTFPKGTMLAAQKTIPFAAAVTKLSANPDDTAVLYPNGTVAVRYEPREIQSSPAPAISVPEQPKAVAVTVPSASITAPQRAETLPAPVPTPGPDLPPAAPEMLVAALGAAERSAAPWLFGVAALAAVAVGGYLALHWQRREPDASEKLKREAEQFDIVE